MTAQKTAPSGARKNAATFGFSLGGEFRLAANGRQVLIEVFRALGDRDPGFYERFAGLEKHGTSRRYLARASKDLNPRRPEIAEKNSVEIRRGWWLSTHHGFEDMEAIIRLACSVTDLEYDRDLKLQFG